MHGSLVGVVAAGGRDHRRAEVAARLQPARVGAEPVGQHRRRRARRGSPRARRRSGSRGRAARAAPARLGLAQVRRERCVVPRAVRRQHVVVAVDLQHGVGQSRTASHERRQQGRCGSMLARRLFTCSPTRNGPSLARGRRWREAIVARSTTCGCASTCAVRPHRRSISSAAPGVRVTTSSARRHQHVELGVVQVAARRGAGCAGRGRSARTSGRVRARRRRRRDRSARVERVEAEVDVEDVEVVPCDPVRAEHHRRPPRLLGGAAGGVRVGVGQPA